MKRWLPLESAPSFPPQGLWRDVISAVSESDFFLFFLLFVVRLIATKMECCSRVLIYFPPFLNCRDSDAPSTGATMILWCSMRCCFRSSRIVWCQRFHQRGCWEVNLCLCWLEGCGASVIAVMLLKIDVYKTKNLCFCLAQKASLIVHYLEVWITANAETPCREDINVKFQCGFFPWKLSIEWFLW